MMSECESYSGLLIFSVVIFFGALKLHLFVCYCLPNEKKEEKMKQTLSFYDYAIVVVVILAHFNSIQY